MSNPLQPHITEPVPGLGQATGGRLRRTPTGPSFEGTAKAVLDEFEVITQGEHNEGYVEAKSIHVRVHLLPFFGDTALKDNNAGRVQDYRVHLQMSRVDAKTGKPKKPARATLHG
ncbi:hypothetical protein OAS19_01380 [Altererythrobacter sp.]|nr:hypothetical protein [Altererythrobacter sp.]